MKGIHTWAVLMLAALAAAACQNVQEKRHITEAEREAAMRKTPPPLHLGAVHQVFPEKHFALLRIIGPLPQEGAVLITHPPDGATDRMGNLRVSSAQNSRSNIIAADIRSGTVIKGDRVFMYRTIAPIEDEEEQTPAEEEGTPATPTDDTLPEAPKPELPEPAALPRPDIPEPAAEEPESKSVETTVLPEQDSANTPDIKLIQDVPDTIHGWE